MDIAHIDEDESDHHNDDLWIKATVIEGSGRGGTEGGATGDRTTAAGVETEDRNINILRKKQMMNQMVECVIDDDHTDHCNDDLWIPALSETHAWILVPKSTQTLASPS